MDEWKKKKYYSYLGAEEKERVKTARQWALLGYLPTDPTKGTGLYANRFCQNYYFYFSIEEVRKGTQEELYAFFEPEREERRERARRKRAYYAELRPLRKYQKQCEKITGKIPFLPEACTRSIVIDTETTGLHPYRDEILQLSILDAETGKKLYNEYFRPVHATHWEEAQRINGISPRKVANKKPIHEHLAEIQRIVNTAHTIIGYNTDFDLDFLASYGVDFQHVDSFIDVMRDYSPEHWLKLTACASELGYDWGKYKAHDSLGDCRATLYCYKTMQKHE